MTRTRTLSDPRTWAGLREVLALGGVVLAGMLLLACGNRKVKAPDWVLSAPAATVMAVSGSTGWVLEQPHFQTLLERYPMAEQSLDLFLKQARINPHQETGRVTFYVLANINMGTPPQASDFLIQLGGFRDPGALNSAIAEAFPPEGSLSVAGRELPLFVLMDFNQYHIRAVVDGHGRIWLGDLGALGKLGRGNLPDSHPVVQSAQWINGGAVFQGIIKPQGLLQEAASKLPPELAKNLPQGMDALAWSVTPGSGAKALHRFELAIAGSPEGITQVAPWLQRLVAAATGLQGGSAQPPEILQESRRIGLRAQLTQEQVNIALSKLNQPGINFGRSSGVRRP